MTCLPSLHIALLSSTLSHAYHLPSSLYPRLIPESSESPVKRIGRAALSRFAIASFAAIIPFNTHHEDMGGFQPSNQDMYIFWVSFRLLFLTESMFPAASWPRTISISPAFARSAPMPHPSSPHRHCLACTQTHRRQVRRHHRHPVTARRTRHNAVTARRASPTSNPHKGHNATTVHKSHCNINSTWRASPATTQAANNRGHWRRQQYGDNMSAAMTTTMTERHT
ncbi:hypothetical protein EDB83DRAFT_1599969 [Lactarius deliciosus]|nr:hypothetical protein EDB83DRAFT_1599969 [Lactarius deliciosus]